MSNWPRLLDQRDRVRKLYWTQKLRSVDPSGNPRPICRALRGMGDDLWFWMNTRGYRRFPAIRDRLPEFPDPAVQERFVGRSGDAALDQAFRGYLLFKRMMEAHARPLGDQTRILDFGCGWGRIIRFFLRDVPPDNLLGVDCMDAAIEICRRTNPLVAFRQSPPLPPIDLPDSSFDLIYLYSVFSHLSEEAHDRWLSEFRRILRPGGLLIATVRPREFIDECEQARRSGTGYEAMARAFEPADDSLARYDRGEFCFSGTGGGDNLATDFYGEACIPESYVKARWTDRFEFLEFVDRERSGLDQHAAVVRVPG